MKKFKVNVSGLVQVVAAQQALFSMGYRWGSGAALHQIAEIVTIFASEEGFLSYSKEPEDSREWGRAFPIMFLTEDGKIVDALPVASPEPVEEKTVRKTALARAVGSSTSKAAAMSFDPTQLELEVLNAVRKFPNGATQDDVLAKLRSISHSSITPRFRPLLDKGLLVDTGEKRKGMSGRGQRVMKVSE